MRQKCKYAKNCWPYTIFSTQKNLVYGPEPMQNLINDQLKPWHNCVIEAPRKKSQDVDLKIALYVCLLSPIKRVLKFGIYGNPTPYPEGLDQPGQPQSVQGQHKVDCTQTVNHYWMATDSVTLNEWEILQKHFLHNMILQ